MACFNPDIFNLSPSPTKLCRLCWLTTNHTRPIFLPLNDIFCLSHSFRKQELIQQIATEGQLFKNQLQIWAKFCTFDATAKCLIWHIWCCRCITHCYVSLWEKNTKIGQAYAQHVTLQEKNEDIWISPMIKAPTPTEKSKKQHDGTITPPKTIADQRPVGVITATHWCG